MKRPIITFFILLGLSNLSFAADFFIEGLQAPAWVERNGQREALNTDTLLSEQDIIITGDSGKLWLQMADGAIVKLGNNARMKVKSIAVQEATSTTQKTLEAGLEIMVGAFRYTTSKLEQHISQNWQRRVDIQLASTAAIGIRGTDLWGQVASDNQFVVLLEGNINITPSASGASPVVLDQPLQIFKVENNSPMPISTVDMSAVQSLAPETELDFGAGVQQTDGNFRVYLSSTQSETAAKRLINALNKRGYAVHSEEAIVYDEYWTRIVLDNAVSEEDARSLANKLGDELDVISPWVQEL